MELEITRDGFLDKLPAVLDAVRGLDDKPYILSIAERRNKRSTDANAYFWALCNQLSAKTRVAPDEIYRDLIRHVGGNFDVLCMVDQAVEPFIRHWSSKGIGWVAEVIGESKLRGCTNVRAFYGSSEYDTAQMARLIDLMVQECRQQGIATDDDRIRTLLEEWDHV